VTIIAFNTQNKDVQMRQCIKQHKSRRMDSVCVMAYVVGTIYYNDDFMVHICMQILYKT